MITIIDALVQPALKAGISIPLDIEEYDPLEYPHWHAFRCLQLDKIMKYPSEHWDNAEVIASLTREEVHNFGLPEIIERGFSL